MTLQEMLQKRANLLKKMRDMLEKAKAESRDFTEDEQKEFDGLETEVQTLEKNIEREQKLFDREKELDEPASKFYRPLPAVDHEKTPDKQDDGGFKNMGEFVHAVKFGDPKGRLKDLATSEVGILIPPAFSQEILQLVPEQEIVMPRANVIPAGDPPDSEFTVPYFQQGADGALGGIELVWTAEGKQVADVNDPKIKDLTLKPQEVSGMATINNKTLQNWQASGAFIQGLLRQAWVSGRDYKFLRGSGVGTPLGILNAPGVIKIARDTALTIKFADVANMMGRLYPEALNNAIWVASITLLPTIAQLKDDAGQLIYVAGDATRGIPASLLGRPIHWTGKTPTLGNEGDLMLTDFNYFLIKPGSGPFIAISEHVKFTTNKTVFKIVANIDGQPWVKDPLMLEDKETTVSPYVILK